ncbi:hypothetical protein HGRIS_012303 [Hohenbuehelia grisea]|uniref:Peptidase M43 pregnancy-associated plasma-A domain-containing protein n=1 Tax=Hohenbuehelia grisea TaxID=104357 RepID=A0ABR3IRU6_9AGAR
MFPSSILCLIFSTLPIFASASSCKTHITDSQLIAAERHYRESLTAGRIANRHEGSLQVVIHTHWHVVYANETTFGGDVANETIFASIDLLNWAFKKGGLAFSLSQENITRTKNAGWFESVREGNEDSMKKQLRKGGPAELNIYTLSVGSWATFPHDYAKKPSNDGVIYSIDALPGGWRDGRNLGHGLIHEVGHWAGLLHTFQGGCRVGDQVDDTPPELYPSKTCVINRDTCPGDNVTDPIHNFMDYSWDNCTSEFTPGQMERMRGQMRTYRDVDL